jgi:hypothetical protein
MPYAANITASDAASNRPLNVSTNNSGLTNVSLGAQRSDGYEFVLNFDLKYGLVSLNGWNGGAFALLWQEYGWDRLGDSHPIPETFTIALPHGATFIDSVGVNVMTLNTKITGEAGPAISFTIMAPPQQRFGWTIIYQDFTWRNANINQFMTVSATTVGLAYAANQPIPFLPLTLGGMSLWAAILSIFLLGASELLSPIYSRAGILINRRRLRILALLLMVLFLAITAYEVITTLLAPPAH